MSVRNGKVKRDTTETAVKVDITLDGAGNMEIATGIRFFDHMLAQLAQHGLFDIKVSATGPDHHHVVEDVAISLGRAFSQALGDRQGITRMAHALVPMDDTLALVAVDIGGRGYSVIKADFDNSRIDEMPSDLIRHFIVSFAQEAKINIHVRIMEGLNDHHKAEAIFKALARALDSATRYDDRLLDRIPSTKDIIES